MQEVFSYLAPPLIGGVIGYVTNDIAIKMLFRPYTAKYIGKVQLPFTPGIVPRRLQELAVLLGREVEARFFNADDLEILFQSDVFSGSIAESLADMLYSRRTSLCLAMEKLEDSDAYGPAIRGAKAELCRRAAEAIDGFDFAPLICTAAESLAEKRGSSGKNAIITFAPALSDGIREYFRQHGEEVLAPMLEEVLVAFGDRPVKAIVSEAFPEREELVEIFKALWLGFMAQYVRPVVESIDVGGMITDKLRLMEPQAVEALILSVVKREFQYVVWLGGLLGAVIGTVNIFI